MAASARPVPRSSIRSSQQTDATLGSNASSSWRTGACAKRNHRPVDTGSSAWTSACEAARCRWSSPVADAESRRTSASAASSSVAIASWTRASGACSAPWPGAHALFKSISKARRSEDCGVADLALGVLSPPPRATAPLSPLVSRSMSIPRSRATSLSRARRSRTRVLQSAGSSTLPCESAAPCESSVLVDLVELPGGAADGDSSPQLLESRRSSSRSSLSPSAAACSTDADGGRAICAGATRPASRCATMSLESSSAWASLVALALVALSLVVSFANLTTGLGSPSACASLAAEEPPASSVSTESIRALPDPEAGMLLIRSECEKSWMGRSARTWRATLFESASSAVARLRKMAPSDSSESGGRGADATGGAPMSSDSTAGVSGRPARVSVKWRPKESALTAATVSPRIGSSRAEGCSPSGCSAAAEATARSREDASRSSCGSASTASALVTRRRTLEGVPSSCGRSGRGGSMPRRRHAIRSSCATTRACSRCLAHGRTSPLVRRALDERHQALSSRRHEWICSWAHVMRRSASAASAEADASCASSGSCSTDSPQLTSYISDGSREKTGKAGGAENASGLRAAGGSSSEAADALCGAAAAGRIDLVAAAAT